MRFPAREAWTDGGTGAVHSRGNRLEAGIVRGTMKLRNILIGTAASMALVAGFAGTTSRAAVSAPFITGVSIKLEVPSTLTKSGSLAGSFNISIVETGANSDDNFFNLYRNTARFGDQLIQNFFTGQSTTDLVLDNFGSTTYEMVACQSTGVCQSDGGGPHGGVTSVTFTPNTVDNPFSVTSGTGSVVSNTKAYGGTELQTTGNGATVSWTADSAFNDGVVIDTGPKGGVGQVYVNGKKVKGPAGLINFYSTKTAGCLIDFKTGTANAQINTIMIVAVSAGAKGGFGMNLDAGVEFES
jgi:hypothetical protein